jgi:carboxymethylenebutenolidase
MMDVSERAVTLKTQDGMADCYFVGPVNGAHPGVILWPDALGLRPAYRDIGKRLAGSGYSVLVTNPYYRTMPAPLDVDMNGFNTSAGREKVMRLASAVTPAMTTRDAEALADYLDQQNSVDPHRKLGTVGYCLGGAMAFRTAIGLADRVGAVAAFHGARLVTPEASSPHLHVSHTRSAALIAIAESDDENAPAAKSLLRKAYDSAHLAAEIEVYAGTKHGWCVPDARVYDPSQADRAWSRLLLLFGTALA